MPPPRRGPHKGQGEPTSIQINGHSLAVRHAEDEPSPRLDKNRNLNSHAVAVRRAKRHDFRVGDGIRGRRSLLSRNIPSAKRHGKIINAKRNRPDRQKKNNRFHAKLIPTARNTPQPLFLP